MNDCAPSFVRSEFKHRTLIELISEPVSALLGVSPSAVDALAKIHIRTVFDLAVSAVFTASTEILRAAMGDDKGLGLYGIVPLDLIDDDALGASFAELSGRPPAALRSLDSTVAQALATALTVADIRELALWPPYQHARSILAEAYGRFDDAQSSSEAPQDLIPASQRYATERVQYDVLVLDAASIAPPTPPGSEPPSDGWVGTSRTDKGALWPSGKQSVTKIEGVVLPALESVGQLDVSKLALESGGFTRPANGVLLTYTQSWYTQGLSLGQLLHTVALAPGESTRIAMIDWSRRSRAATREGIVEGEALTADILRTRSISEIVSAVATEAQQGFSRSSGWSVGGQIGHAGGGAGSADLSSAGYPIKLAAGHGESIGIGGGYGQAETTAWTTGQRNLSANLAQNVTDKTHQASTSSRNRWATIVREVSQEESERISTRSVTNYNHMHALSIEYFEIVQLYRVVVELSKATPCLFVPMKVLNFEQPGVVARFRGAIAAAGLTPRVRALALIEPDRMVFFAPQRTTGWDPAPISRMLGERVGDRNTPSLVIPLNFYPSRITIDAGTQPFSRLMVTYQDGHEDSFAPEGTPQGIGPIQIDLAKKFEPTPTTPDSSPFWEAVQIRLQRSQSDFAGQVQIRLELSAMGRKGFPMPQESGLVALEFSINVQANDLEPVVFQFTRTVSGSELYRHLADNALYYSQAVWRSLDAAAIGQLLCMFTYEGRPLLSSIDPLPIAVSGNYVIFRRHLPPADKAATDKWEAWLKSQEITLGERRQSLVPLPSGGVFAEAVLGRFNSAEKLDITRFWNWQDSPIPITPPEIAAIQAGSRAQTENLMPGQLSPPVLKVELPPNIPDPEGLKAILQAIQNANMFRDMSGVNATIGFAQSALGRAFDSARDAAAQAGENMKTAAEIYKSAFGGQGSTTPGATTRPSSTGAARNPSETGALINQGRDMDNRDLNAGSSGSTTAGARPGTSGAGSQPLTASELAAFNAAIENERTSGAKFQFVSNEAGTNLPPIAVAAQGDALVGDSNGPLDLSQAVMAHLNSLASAANLSCVAASANYFAEAMQRIGVPMRSTATDGDPVVLPAIATANGNFIVSRTLVVIWFSNANDAVWPRIPDWCRGAGAPGALLYAGLVENNTLLSSGTRWPQGMRPGAYLQLWSSETEYQDLRDKGAIPSLGHSCVFHSYVQGNPARIVASDQLGLAREITYPAFGLKYVIAANLSKARLMKFT